MTLAELNFTPAQGVLLFRKVFDYATRADLEKLENTIRFELERHSTARHEMRHEVVKLQASMVRVETLMEALPERIKQSR